MFVYDIFVYILLGIPGIFPIHQDEGWQLFWISQPGKGYGLTMQTFATDLFSLSIETIYLMFWKDVFLLHFSPERHKQLVVLRCVFPSCWGSPQRHVWLWNGCWFPPAGITCTGPRHVGVVPWCFGLSCHQGEGQASLDVDPVMWPV